MDVKGQRVLIFGDSLTARSGAPVQVDITEGTDRRSSSPGDLLASQLLAAGAAAARINARVGRSAWNFWQREEAAKLIAADLAWQPTIVFVMLGTNDIGLNLTKDRQALERIRDAYAAGGAQLVGIGPPAFSVERLAEGSPGVVAMHRKVFGPDRVVDARPLSQDLLEAPGRAGDRVHFTAAGAAALAPRLAAAIAGLPAAPRKGAPWKPLGIGFGLTLGLGALIGGMVWVSRRREQLGAADNLPAVRSPQEVQKAFEQLGWQLQAVELNMETGAAKIELKRFDGRLLTLVRDSIGRSSITSEYLEAEHGHVGYRRGDRIPWTSSTYRLLSRAKFGPEIGLRSVLRLFANYVGDNALHGDRLLAKQAVAKLIPESTGESGQLAPPPSVKQLAAPAPKPGSGWVSASDGKPPKLVAIGKLYVSPRKMGETIIDVREGRTSYSKYEPIVVSRLDSGDFYVMDGHHRLLERITDGEKKLPIVFSNELPRIEHTGGAYAAMLAVKQRAVDLIRP